MKKFVSTILILSISTPSIIGGNLDLERRCTTANNCNNQIINCPEDESCTIHCQESNACQDTTINGDKAKELKVFISENPQSMNNGDITCPKGNDKSCVIQIESDNNTATATEAAMIFSTIYLPKMYPLSIQATECNGNDCIKNAELLCDQEICPVIKNDHDLVPKRCNECSVKVNGEEFVSNKSSNIIQLPLWAIIVIVFVVAIILFAACVHWHCGCPNKKENDENQRNS